MNFLGDFFVYKSVRIMVIRVKSMDLRVRLFGFVFGYFIVG